RSRSASPGSTGPARPRRARFCCAVFLYQEAVPTAEVVATAGLLPPEVATATATATTAAPPTSSQALLTVRSARWMPAGLPAGRVPSAMTGEERARNSRAAMTFFMGNDLFASRKCPDPEIRAISIPGRANFGIEGHLQRIVSRVVAMANFEATTPGP